MNRLIDRSAVTRGAAWAALLTGLVVLLAAGPAIAQPGANAAPAPSKLNRPPQSLHVNAEQSYKVNCVVCHGEDGRGTDTGKSLNTPDLHSEAVQKQTDAMLVQIISEGKNNMPPFMSTLSKAEIQGLVAYVRSFGKKAK